MKVTRFIGYTLPSGFLSIRIAIFSLAFTLCLGACGFMYLEEYTLVEAIYMTMITISTVGYTEVQPLNTAGQIFTSCLIVLNVLVFAYALAVFSYYVVQGEIFKQMHVSMINKKISELENHVIICGYGRYGAEIVEHFNQHDTPFVIIDNDEQRVEEIRHSRNHYLYLHADATTDETLLAAGIKKASAFITALPNDSDNVYTVLTARQLKPTINIVSRASSDTAISKLKLAGANHIVTPEQLGGFYMAMLISKPHAIEFFSFLASNYEGNIRFEEIDYECLPTKYQNKSIQELDLRVLSGANVIGFRSKDGKYTVNPDSGTILTVGTSFIVLGTSFQLEKMRKHLGLKEN